MKTLVDRRDAAWLAIRSVPLRPLLGTTVVAVAATVWMVADRPDEPLIVLEALRLSAMLLALGLVFTWDDTAADTLASAPRTLLWRRGVRLLVGLPVVVTGWLIVVPTAHAVSDDVFACTPRPDAGLAVELAGLSVLGLVVSGYAARQRRSHPGTMAAMTIVVVGVGLGFVPERWTFHGGEPGSSTWMDAHLRWAALAAVAVCGLLWLSRDPAARRVIRPRRSTLGVVAIAVLLAGGLASLAVRDAGRDAALAEVLAEQQVVEGVPALAAAVVFADGATWIGAVGEASPGQPVSADHAFAQASITKLYVATLTLAVAERGLVDLAAPVGAWLPELPGFAEVSLQQLLSHTAGMADPDELFSLFDDHDRIWTPADALAVAASEPVFEPGTEFGYANVGYVAAGLVLERITGDPLDELVERHVLADGWSEETWLQAPEAEHGAPVAHAHLDTDGDGVLDDVTAGHELVPWTSIGSAAWAAGGIVAPVDDVAGFGHRLFGGELLGPETLGRMIPEATAPGGGDYGLGVMRVGVGDGEAFGHTGDMPGTATELWHLSDEDLTVAVAMNGTAGCGTAVQAIIETAIDAGR